MNITDCTEVRSGINFIEAVGKLDDEDYFYARFRQGDLIVRFSDEYSDKYDDKYIDEEEASSEYKLSLNTLRTDEFRREYGSIEKAIEQEYNLN